MTARQLRGLGSLAITISILVAPRMVAAQVQFGAEGARDRSVWHFDNPSTFDTATPVPHFFEQRYTLDNLWFTAAARYRAGLDWHTSVSVTPVRQALATDYDTFFDPDGSVWVSGTTGDARMHAFRLGQTLELGRLAAVTLTGGYRLRMEWADFLAGDKTDTRNGVIVMRAVVTTREYTTAQTHEIYLTGSHVGPVSGGWQLELAGEVAPAAVNRLAIALPDKYAGQTLVYQTTTFMANGRAVLARTAGAWPLALTVQAGHAWNYHATQRADRSQVVLGVTFGRRWS